MLINMEKGPDAYPGTLGSMGIIVGWHKLLVGGGGLPNVRSERTLDLRIDFVAVSVWLVATTVV